VKYPPRSVTTVGEREKVARLADQEREERLAGAGAACAAGAAAGGNFNNETNDVEKWPGARSDVSIGSSTARRHFLQPIAPKSVWGFLLFPFLPQSVSLVVKN